MKHSGVPHLDCPEDLESYQETSSMQTWQLEAFILAHKDKLRKNWVGDVAWDIFKSHFPPAEVNRVQNLKEEKLLLPSSTDSRGIFEFILLVELTFRHKMSLNTPAPAGADTQIVSPFCPHTAKALSGDTCCDINMTQRHPLGQRHFCSETVNFVLFRMLIFWI